jgi:hypothetical protein
VSAVGDFLYTLLILGGLGGGAVFVSALVIPLRGRRHEGAGQERLRLAQAEVHARYRDRLIVREAFDEVAREDAKDTIRRARAGVSK